MPFDIRHPEFTSLFDPDAPLETVVDGFEFTEGPIWHRQDNCLYFSDIVGNTQYRWSAGDGLTVFRQPSHKANGNAFDSQGRILSCEHSTSRVTRTVVVEGRAGETEPLASHFDGQELNSPNDIVVSRDGSVYFTDPTYGRTERYGRLREPVLGFRGVYRLEPDTGGLTLLADDFAQPNGLCFSLDGQQLFVNDTERLHIRVFAVQADGSLRGGDVWAQTVGSGPGRPDGMKIDAAGNVFCIGQGGVHVFRPDATCLGVVLIPEHPANLCFGGEDLSSLYITASTSVYRVQTKTVGAPGV